MNIKDTPLAPFQVKPDECQGSYQGLIATGLTEQTSFSEVYLALQKLGE